MSVKNFILFILTKLGLKQFNLGQWPWIKNNVCFFQDLGEIANSDVQSLMKNRIDWRSQSVEDWLRHNFEERDRRDSRDNGNSEKISKIRQMDQFNQTKTIHCSEKEICKYQHPPRDKLSGYNSMKIVLFNLKLFKI